MRAEQMIDCLKVSQTRLQEQLGRSGLCHYHGWHALELKGKRIEKERRREG